MNIFPIRTEADYEKALARIEMLMDAEPNTREGDELDIMTSLVEHYEAKHFPIHHWRLKTGTITDTFGQLFIFFISFIFT